MKFEIARAGVVKNGEKLRQNKNVRPQQKLKSFHYWLVFHYIRSALLCIVQSVLKQSLVSSFYSWRLLTWIICALFSRMWIVLENHWDVKFLYKFTTWAIISDVSASIEPFKTFTLQACRLFEIRRFLSHHQIPKELGAPLTSQHQLSTVKVNCEREQLTQG